MADIVCAECNAQVTDESGYCPECGFPFEAIESEERGVDETGDDAPPQNNVTTPLDIILRSIDSIRAEMKELQNRVDATGRDLQSHAALTTESSQKMLADVSSKLEVIASVQGAIQASLQAEDAQKKKSGLFAALYKTLNSPNSMFEYMFYICIVQIIFVIVSLFLSAYIVSLVRQ